MAALKQYLYPNATCSGSPPLAGAPRKGRKPTEIEVLTATVNAIQHGSLPHRILFDPVPAPERGGGFPGGEGGHGAGGLAAECTALLQRVSVTKPELASSLPRTSAEVRLKHGRVICEALIRKFQGPHMQDVIATAFEAAGIPHVGPSSPQPPLARRNGAAARAALAARLFRLCSPVALQVVHDMGVATTMNTSDFFDTLRVMWALPASRRAYAQVRCLWFAPRLASQDADAERLPVKRLLQQLQQLVEGIAAVFTKHAGPTGPDEPFLQVQYRSLGVIQYIMPLWEDCAGSMGLPRDMEGVARLQRAAMACADPRVAELTWATFLAFADAPQLVRTQQALCEL